MSAEQPNTEGLEALPPQIFTQNLSPTTAETSLRLRPLWIGFVLASMSLALSSMVVWNDPFKLLPEQALFDLAPFVYYFMCIHRVMRVMAAQSGWSSHYSPSEVVWTNFIPFYGTYVQYGWTRDVESYTNWRLGDNSRSGLWAFFGLLIADFLVPLAVWGYGEPDNPLNWTNQLSGVSYVIQFASLLLLYRPIRRCLIVPIPQASLPRRYERTLRLR